MQKKQIKTLYDARNFAIDWQHWMSDQNLSYKEIAEWQEFFVALGKQFGLTEEFEENGII